MRTYWSPDAVKRVTGYELEGVAAEGFIDLRNSGATTLNATGQEKDAEATRSSSPGGRSPRRRSRPT